MRRGISTVARRCARVLPCTFTFEHQWTRGRDSVMACHSKHVARHSDRARDRKGIRAQNKIEQSEVSGNLARRPLHNEPHCAELSLRVTVEIA